MSALSPACTFADRSIGPVSLVALARSSSSMLKAVRTLFTPRSSHQSVTHRCQYLEALRSSRCIILANSPFGEPAQFHLLCQSCPGLQTHTSQGKARYCTNRRFRPRNVNVRTHMNSANSATIFACRHCVPCGGSSDGRRTVPSQRALRAARSLHAPAAGGRTVRVRHLCPCDLAREL